MWMVPEKGMWMPPPKFVRNFIVVKGWRTDIEGSASMKRLWRLGGEKPVSRLPVEFLDDEDSVGFFQMNTSVVHQCYGTCRCRDSNTRSCCFFVQLGTSMSLLYWVILSKML